VIIPFRGVESNPLSVHVLSIHECGSKCTYAERKRLGKYAGYGVKMEYIAWRAIAAEIRIHKHTPRTMTAEDEVE
jgi:hypothetical protein